MIRVVWRRRPLRHLCHQVGRRPCFNVFNWRSSRVSVRAGHGARPTAWSPRCFGPMKIGLGLPPGHQACPFSMGIFLCRAPGCAGPPAVSGSIWIRRGKSHALLAMGSRLPCRSLDAGLNRCGRSVCQLAGLFGVERRARSSRSPLALLFLLSGVNCGPVGCPQLCGFSQDHTRCAQSGPGSCSFPITTARVWHQTQHGNGLF